MTPTYSIRLTKYQLAQYLFTSQGERDTLLLPDGKRAIVQSVQRESGSGRSFNIGVAVLPEGRAAVVSARTTD